MAESAVTVVRCCGCRLSGQLSLLEGRFWCAWCQRWAEVEAEKVLGATVVLDGDNFRLARAPEPTTGLQPLRIPPGWQIIWNTLFAEDPTEPKNANGYYCGTVDLFLASSERLRQAIDIEWRTRDDPAESAYILQVLPIRDDVIINGAAREDTGWDAPLHTFETRIRAELVAELERWLSGITA